MKGLIGISPSGYPSSVSSLYAGRPSDKKITKDCGIPDLLEPGDQVIADQGFDIESDLPSGVTFLGWKRSVVPRGGANDKKNSMS